LSLLRTRAFYKTPHAPGSSGSDDKQGYREAGGIEYREPQDDGWMYGRGFQDVHGHLWKIISMDESAIKKE
jgi:hypothetical protein